MKVRSVDNDETLNYADRTAPRGAAFKAALRRSLVLTIFLCIAGAAVGAFVGEHKSDSYTAEASILIEPLDGNPFSPTGNGDDLVNLQSEAQLLKSDPVARQVQSDLGIQDSPQSIIKNLSVTVPPNTQILTLDYTATDRSTALQRADSFASTYLEYRKSRAEKLVTGQVDRIHDRIVKRKKARDALVARLSRLEPSSAAAKVLSQRIDSASAQINQLQAQSAELETGSTKPGQVITPAAVASSGLVGARLLFACLGLVIGFGVALSIALARARLDPRVHRVEDVQARGHSVLGDVSPGDARDMVVIARDNASTPHLTDSFKRLRIALLSGEARRPLSILLTSAASDPVSPVTSVGFALSTALANLETVIVDATMLAAGPTKDLNGQGRPGLSDVLTESTTVDAALIPVAPHLTLLPSGERQIDADDLFIAPQMSELLDELRKRADVIWVVSGSTRQTNVQALSALVDRAVIEATRDVTRQDDIEAFRGRGEATDPTSYDVVYVLAEGRRRTAAKTP